MKNGIKIIFAAVLFIVFFVSSLFIPIFAVTLMPTNNHTNMDTNKYKIAFDYIIDLNNAVTRLDISIIQSIDEVLLDYLDDGEVAEDDPENNNGNIVTDFVDITHLATRINNYILVIKSPEDQNIIVLKSIEEIEAFVNQQIDLILNKYNDLAREDINEIISFRLTNNLTMGQYKSLDLAFVFDDEVNFGISARFSYYNSYINKEEKTIAKYKPHRALDLFTSQGTALLSIADNGKVIKVTNVCKDINTYNLTDEEIAEIPNGELCNLYGNMVTIRYNINSEIETSDEEIIDYDLTIDVVYAHLDDVLVGVDQIVNEKEVIGTVGNTGNSSGNHLHLETQIVDGGVKLINPEFFWFLGEQHLEFDYLQLLNLFPLMDDGELEDYVVDEVENEVTNFLKELDVLKSLFE